MASPFSLHKLWSVSLTLRNEGEESLYFVFRLPMLPHSKTYSVRLYPNSSAILATNASGSSGVAPCWLAT